MHKAIVEEVIDKYNIRVRIPFYDKAAESASATKFEDLSIACICTPAGESPALLKGDIVFVDFEDNNIGKPVIIGTLFRESGVKSKTNISANSLEVLVDSNIEGVVKSVNGMTGNVIIQPGSGGGGGGDLPDNLVYHDEETVPEDIPPVVDATARSQIQQIVPVENTTTASRAYSIGDYFVNASGILVKATAVIALGATINSTNSTAVNETLGNDLLHSMSASKAAIITPNGSVDVSGAFVRQYGNVITLNGCFVNVPLVANTYVHVVTISNVSMPLGEMRALCGVAANSYEHPQDVAYMSVSNTGQIHVNSSLTGTKAVYFSIAYTV